MSKLRPKLDAVLSKEIDRKQFLQYSLAVFLAAFGVTSFISTILTSFDKRPPAAPPAPKGYGSSRYNQ